MRQSSVRPRQFLNCRETDFPDQANANTMKPDATKPSRPEPAKVSRLAFLAVFTWAVFSTAFFVGYLFHQRNLIEMRIPPAMVHHHCRKNLDLDILICQSEICREAGRLKAAGLEGSFGDRLGELIAERTAALPGGLPDVFQVWLSARTEDWLDPPFDGRTNLVIVSMNAQRYGENYQWWTNGVLYSTADEDLSGAGLGDTNRWRTTVCYSQFGSGAFWWRHPDDWYSADRDGWSLEKFGVWDVPYPYPKK